MQNNLFKFSDLYHAAGWLFTRIGYTLFSLPLLNRYATMKGRFKALTSEERFTVKKNLASTFGEARNEKEIDAIARRYFEFSSKFEMLLRVLPLKGFATPEHWPVEGLQHLEAALTQGKGVILLSAHFGYARFMKYILETSGRKIHVVGSQFDRNSKAERRSKEFFNQLTAFGKQLHKRLALPAFDFSFRDLYADFNIRPLLDVLQKNGIILIMGDGTRASNLIPMDFLGRKLPFSAGTTRIALLTGATILPAFAVDTNHGNGIKVIIEKPLVLEKNKASSPEVIAKNVATFVQVLETYVKQYPQLYKVVYKEDRFARKMARSQRDAAERYIPAGRTVGENLVQ